MNTKNKINIEYEVLRANQDAVLTTHYRAGRLPVAGMQLIDGDIHVQSHDGFVECFSDTPRDISEMVARGGVLLVEMSTEGHPLSETTLKL